MGWSSAGRERGEEAKGIMSKENEVHLTSFSHGAG